MKTLINFTKILSVLSLLFIHLFAGVYFNIHNLGIEHQTFFVFIASSILLLFIITLKNLEINK